MRHHATLAILTAACAWACKNPTPQRAGSAPSATATPSATPGGTPRDDATPPAAGPDLTLSADPTRPGYLAKLRVPPGFEVSYWAQEVDNARQLARAEDGTIFVGSRRAGNVYALRDADGDGVAEYKVVFASGLNNPNGVAPRGEDLYVAEIDRILKYEGALGRLEDPPEPVVVSTRYPSDRSHGWKHIAFGPDGKLYVPQGAPCNVCERDDPIYGTITRIDPDGGGFEVVARGVRNTVGFTWHPETGELWFTDNGRDWMGDDAPSDELNRLTEPGQHFGFPYCHQGDVLDPKLGQGKDCGDYRAPARKLGAHVAALGLEFYRGEMFPERYQGHALVAEHGSWNRSVLSGYRVTLAQLDARGEVTSYAPFVDGWLDADGRTRWGRPVDVLELPDGSVLVSDDYGDAIFRVTYSPPSD